jgi:hypothetical protein
LPFFKINRVVISEIQNNNSVETALFCVDRWRDGLFNCIGRNYNSLSDLENEVEGSRLNYMPTNSYAIAAPVLTEKGAKSQRPS